MQQNVNPIINFFFPPLCLHCRREGTWLCSNAQADIDQLKVLKNPLPIEGVDSVYCRGEYDEPILENIIQKVKYDFLTAPTEIFPILLKPLSQYVKSNTNGAAIIPIPLHWRRQLARGFNQSEFVARALSENTNLHVLNLLQRHRPTTPQAKLTEQQRVKNVVGAFRLRNVAKVPYSAILVDDVITTGSTIRECASVLRQAGVHSIVAVALAKG